MVGKVISINKKTITVENNYVGYVINVTKPDNFETNKIKKLYLYKHMSTNNKNNLIEELYGFEQYEYKELFLMLININGIGPKTALNVCSNDINTLKQLIAQRDIQSLSILVGITPKYARIIVDNLYDVFMSRDNQSKGCDLSKLVQALKSLGYGAKDIEFALKHINLSNEQDIDLSDLISQSIKLIAQSQEDASTFKTN
jgi:Holliday junction DNA helicase RuvA